MVNACHELESNDVPRLPTAGSCDSPEYIEPAGSTKN